MKTFEKLTIAIVVISVAIATALYGVWEDKVMLFAPLLTMIYIALAIWAIGSGFGVQGSGLRGQDSGREQTSEIKPFSSFIFHLSSFSIPPGGGMLLLFFLYSAVMIPFSAVPYEAKINVLRFGCYLGTYWVCANSLSRFSRRRIVWGILLIALLAVALYSLVQHKMAPNLLLWTERYTDGWETGRLGGTYICPNHIAHLFQMWIPFCLVFLFIPQFGWFWRICFGYALPVFGLLIYRTQSRAGLLGTVASAGVLMLLLMLRKSRRAFLIALVAVPLLVVAAIGGLWGASSMFRDRMQPVVEVLSYGFSGEWEQAVSIDFRPMTWVDSLRMIKDRPLTGFGPGSYEQTFYKYRQRVVANRMEIDHPHNEPIELLTEYGLIGAVLILWALVSVSIALVRLIKTTDRRHHALPAAAFLAVLAGTAVHGLFDFELRIFPNALMLALLGGCAVAPLMKQRSEVRGQKSESSSQESDDQLPVSDLRSPISRPNGLTSVFRLLISISLLLAAAWALQVMSSAMLRLRGDQLVADKDRGRAEKLYKAAMMIDPQNWRAALGLGQIYSYYRYQELDPAAKKAWALLERDTFAEAWRHNATKEEVIYGLGRAELMAGNREAGLEKLRQAAVRKRFNDFYWRKLGIELRKAGHYSEALDAFLYAKKLNSSNDTVNYNIKWVKKRIGVME